MQLIPVVALALFMSSSAVDAKPRLLQYDAEGRLIAPETSRQKVKRTVEVCLNESGDLVLRRRDGTDLWGRTKLTCYKHEINGL